MYVVVVVGDAVTVDPVVAESAVAGDHETPAMPAGMVHVEDAPTQVVTDSARKFPIPATQTGLHTRCWFEAPPVPAVKPHRTRFVPSTAARSTVVEMRSMQLKNTLKTSVSGLYVTRRVW